MNKLKNLYTYLKNSDTKCTFRPVIDVERNYLYLTDNKGHKIYYDEYDDNFLIKCRVKCIKDDNFINFLDEPFIMDLRAKNNRDVLAIINSKI